MYNYSDPLSSVPSPENIARFLSVIVAVTVVILFLVAWKNTFL